MTDSTPWLVINSYKEDVAPSAPPLPSPPIQAPPSAPAPPTASSSGYMDSEINLNRAADLFLGTALSSNTYNARELLDPTDPRAIAANQVASNIINDLIDALCYYMKITQTDPIRQYMIRLQKMIAVRYFSSPLNAYTPAEMRYRLGVPLQGEDKKKKKRKRQGGEVKALRVNEQGNIDVDPGQVLLDRAENVIHGEGEEEEDTSSEEEEDTPMLTAEETITMIERRTRKIGEIKHASRQNINVWVYNTMYTRSFLTYLGGSIGYDTLNSLCRVDIPDTLLNIYIEKTRDKFDKAPYHELENIGLFNTEQVSEFVKALNPTGSRAENSIVEYLKQDRENPVQCFKELVIPSLLTTTMRAWHYVEMFLMRLKRENPSARGFTVYRSYINKDTEVPDLRLMIKPLPLGTSMHAQVEFGHLVQIYQMDVKNFTLSKTDTRHEVRQKDIKIDEVVRALFARLELMRFDGISSLLPHTDI